MGGALYFGLKRGWEGRGEANIPSMCTIHCYLQGLFQGAGGSFTPPPPSPWD